MGVCQSLGRLVSHQYVRAGRFVRSKAPANFLPPAGGRLIIDGLDEVASATVGGGVDAVLEQLSAISNPPFILSSREADWSGASSRARIEDDYGEAVSILHLEPFDRDDADAFLRSFFPDVDAGAVLDHLAARGLEEIYRDPLTLRMIGEVARAETTLPGNRAELLERACTIMLREENPRHQDTGHALRSDEDLLLAVGAICAGLLLCDHSAVFAGPKARTPADALHLSSVQNLQLADAASEALKTRLFQADGEAGFIAGHRVIAEYLGARWLADCFNRGASERRIRSLITLSGGVPTALRGINAWLAHFSSALAPACIAADPYTVLQYGNAETLPLEQAHILLHELAKLSGEDPYFRAEDWSRHPAAGLMRIELKGDILALLSNERTHGDLAFLLLEAVASSPIAGSLRRDLEAVLFDPDRLYGARSRAANALIASSALNPTEAAIKRLLAFGDSNSWRLAFEILTKLGLSAVPMYLAIETLLAYAGMTVSSLDRKQRDTSVYIPRDLITVLSGPELHVFLDNLANYVVPLMRDGNHRVMEGIVDAARIAVLAALQSNPPVAPGQVWRWLQWTRHHGGCDSVTKKVLRLQFEDNVSLRHGIQAVVLLIAPVGQLHVNVFDLGRVSPGLVPDSEDVIALIELLDARSGGVSDVQRLRDLVSVARTHAGLPSSVRDAALKLAGADPGLIRDLDEWSKPFVDEHEKKQKRRLAKDEAKRQETYGKIRADHAANADAIRAGDFRWLNQTAMAYLGRFSEFSKDDKPEVRVEKLLGAGLAVDALT
jgi:hypothetical protein